MYLLHLEHNILVRYESFLASNRSLPPVVGDLLEKDDGVALVKIDLAG